MIENIGSVWPLFAGAGAASVITFIKPIDRRIKKLLKIEKAVCPYCGKKTLDPRVVFGKDSLIIPNYCGGCGATYRTKQGRTTASGFVFFALIIASCFAPKWLRCIVSFLCFLGITYVPQKLFSPIVKPKDPGSPF